MSRTISYARCEEQISAKATNDVAAIIANKFDVAISMTKQEGFPVYQAKGAIRVKELELQLRSLANWADAGYPDEYSALFHIEEPPLFMRLHNVPADLLQQITDELAKEELASDTEWLGIDEIPNIEFGSRAWFAGEDQTDEQIDIEKWQRETLDTRESDRPV